MTGIWSLSDSRWRPEEPVSFQQEKELHDLIEQAPELLPLAGAPRLVMLGREVLCGRGYADLIAVEVATGRPVIIEIKLASNTDRRQVFTQVLGYAAHLGRLDEKGFDALLHRHLAKQSLASVAAAAQASSQDPGFDPDGFRTRLKHALLEHLLRCVVVIDAATPDLIELIGYLQDVTNDRLSLDLVTVSAYDIGDRRVLVPQLIEPDRSQMSAASRTISAPPATETVKGVEEFEASIDEAQPNHRPGLRQLLEWALDLQAKGLAVLYTSIGKDLRVLKLWLPGQNKGLVAIYNDKGARVSPFRTVFEKQAPVTLALLDSRIPGQIAQGNYIKAAYDPPLLELLRAAYEEAAGPDGHVVVG